MIAPFYKYGLLGPGADIVLGIILGIFFGYTLERAGFSSAKKLVSQFYFEDFTVLKVMFTAIVVAMLGLYYFQMIGWLDMSKVFIPPTYLWAQLVGGLILGTGFALGGYCPGTSVVAASIGKIDGIFFVLGVFFGSALFGDLLFPYIKHLYYGGRMGRVSLPSYFGINGGVMVFIITMIAVAMFWASEWLEQNFHPYKKGGNSEGEGSNN